MEDNILKPVIIQDYGTSKVLMLSMIDSECLEISRDTGILAMPVPYDLTGNYQVREILEQNDGKAYLIKVVPTTGEEDTLFGEVNDPRQISSDDFLFYLEDVIKDRKENPVDGSYTNHLFSRGTGRIAQKVGEEAVELVIEAMGNKKDLFLGESADLIYHFLVLLSQKESSLQEVIEVLKLRHTRNTRGLN